MVTKLGLRFVGHLFGFCTLFVVQSKGNNLKCKHIEC